MVFLGGGGGGKQLELKITPRKIGLNDDGMAACGFLGIFMIDMEVLDTLSENSRDSTTEPTKMIAEQENKFWKDYEKRYSSVSC